MATVRPARTSAPGRAALAPPPAGYAPMRHPGRPHRWDRDSILDALRTGSRRPGVAPASGLVRGAPDDAPPAQRKWMGEHPRWPSSSCVAAHFGSWSKALQAAGLSRRVLTFEESVAERVEAAWRMAAAGQTIRAIADQLGVSVSSVHNYLRARTCPDCGGPVPARWPRAASPAPRICRPFSARGHPRPCATRFSPGLEEHGRPPTYHEWTPSRTRPGRWEAESPRWPSAAVVCDVYRDRADPGTRRSPMPASLSVPALERRCDPLRARCLLDAHRPAADGRATSEPDGTGRPRARWRRYGSVSGPGGRSARSRPSTSGACRTGGRGPRRRARAALRRRSRRSPTPAARGRARRRAHPAARALR